MKKPDLKFTLLAILIITATILLLIMKRNSRPSANPADTPTARKAVQSLRNARSW
ncbi:MAG: hypothetical protein PHV34_13975 [Verrucomicrobiae bacterium]|nr:hypothetical protein [Verrucomicrobiae bacterium]